jgi:hypothetical protein
MHCHGSPGQKHLFYETPVRALRSIEWSTHGPCPNSRDVRTPPYGQVTIPLIKCRGGGRKINWGGPMQENRAPNQLEGAQ